MVEAPAPSIVVVVRVYDVARDRVGVEEVERACEVGCSGGGKMCLFTDLLGDPLCRIRHSPDSLMLVRIHDYIHVRAAPARSLSLYVCSVYTPHVVVVVVAGRGLRLSTAPAAGQMQQAR